MKRVKYNIGLTLSILIVGIILLTGGMTKTVTAKERTENNLVIQDDIEYMDSLETISNPDRGFYIPIVIRIDHSGNFDISSLQATIDTAKASKISLIHLRFDIGQLSKNVNQKEEKEFSNTQLQQINAIFSELRNNKIKAIVRFAYDFDGIPGKEPTDFSKIEGHIKQLSGIFEINKDVISTIEAGMIGVWGEMHGEPYDKEEYYKRLIECYLENTPKEITINVRTPAQYNSKFKEASGDDQYRVGIFNDGYLASGTDLGTFEKRDEFVKFMQTQGIYTMYGGEVTRVDGIDDTYSDIEICSEEMSKTHTTYLNYSYNKDIVESKWESQIYTGKDSEYNGKSAFKYIQDHLGYRLVLRKSAILENVKQGNMCKISLDIENVGFANIITDQVVTIILQKGKKFYEIQTDIEMKEIASGKINKIDFEVCVPNDIKLGEWNLYLKISSLYHSDYTIQFANPDIYGYQNANYIGKVTIVSNTSK